MASPGTYKGQTINAGSDADIQRQLADIDALSPVTPEALADVKPMQPSPTPPSTGATGMLGEFEASSKAYQDSLSAEAEAAKKSEEDSFSLYFDEATNQRGQSSLEDELYAKEADPFKKEVTKLNNDLAAEQHALRRRLEKLDKNESGLFGGALEDEKYRAETESLKRQADIAVILKAKQGQYSDAIEIADRAVAKLMEQQTNRLNALQLSYERNKDLFTTKEQRAFEVKQAERTAALNFEYQKKATDYEQLIKQNDPLYKLDLRLKTAEAEKAERENAATDGTTASIINPLTGKPDPTSYFTSVIKSSGAKDNTNLQAIGGVIAAVQALAEANPSGEFPGIGIFNSPDILKSPEGVANNSYVDAVNLKVQQWASGASLTKQQTEAVARLTPKRGDSYAQIKSKTNALANFMMTQAQGTLASQGVTFTPQSVDFFNDTERVNSFLDVAEEALNDPANLYQQAGYSL
jgi:hypothetical protein